MRTVGPIADVFAAGLPEGADPADRSMRAFLTVMAEQQILEQYNGRLQPHALLLNRVEWLVTMDRSVVEEFQPAHDCVRCLAGQDQLLAFMAAHPDRFVALANLQYSEVWPD